MAELLGLACAIEGHPDNAAAALLGGFVVSAADDGSGVVDAIRFDAPRDLRAVVFVPELRLSTQDMRAALPASVPLKDAVANLSAVAIGVAGLAIGRYELLSRLTVDRLHERYRVTAYPQLPQMVAAAREAGAIGAFLSGAGSTILAFTDSMSGITRIESAFIAAAADSDLPGIVRVVEPRNAGGRVVART
jgi:homoserine kinase